MMMSGPSPVGAVSVSCSRISPNSQLLDGDDDAVLLGEGLGDLLDDGLAGVVGPDHEVGVAALGRRGGRFGAGRFGGGRGVRAGWLCAGRLGAGWVGAGRFGARHRGRPGGAGGAETATAARIDQAFARMRMCSPFRNLPQVDLQEMVGAA